jgi:hypothetical protein
MKIKVVWNEGIRLNVGQDLSDFPTEISVPELYRKADSSLPEYIALKYQATIESFEILDGRKPVIGGMTLGWEDEDGEASKISVTNYRDEITGLLYGEVSGAVFTGPLGEIPEPEEDNSGTFTTAMDPYAIANLIQAAKKLIKLAAYEDALVCDIKCPDIPNGGNDRGEEFEMINDLYSMVEKLDKYSKRFVQMVVEEGE